MEKKMAFWAVFAFLVCFASNCLAGNLTPQELIDLERREIILDDWLAPAEACAEKVGNEEVQGVVNFLGGGGYIVRPTQTGVELVRGAGEDGIIAILPIVPGDEEIPLWKERIESNYASFFLPDKKTPVLVLKSDVIMSDEWKCLALIHEGRHALAFSLGIANDFKDDPTTLRVVDEYYAYSLEFEVLNSIGGSEYQRILKAEANKVKEAFQKDRGIGNPKYDASIIESVFGKAMSKEEASVRLDAFWMHSIFAAMDMLYGKGPKAEEEKLNCLLSLYEGGALK